MKLEETLLTWQSKRFTVRKFFQTSIHVKIYSSKTTASPFF